MPNKSSLFNKMPTVLDWMKTKIKYLLFGLKTKISAKILLLPLKEFVFFLPGSGSG